MQHEPKKHHFIPQFMLRAFADGKSLLRVHRLDQQSTFLARARDIGHRNDGHTLFWPNRPPNRRLLEQQMAQLEADASNAIARMVGSRVTSIPDTDRETIAWFMALQWTRHRWILGRIRSQVLEAGSVEEARGATAWASGSLGLLAGVVPLLSAYLARDDPSADPKDRWNAVVSMLGCFHWRIQRYADPVLVISDNPVCMSGVADGDSADASAAWTRHGVGVGFGTCRRITVPLTPTTALTLQRDGLPQRISARQLNQTTVYNSREFVAHHPSWPGSRSSLADALEEDLRLQRWLRPTFGSSA